MVALNTTQTIRPEELMPQLVVTDNYLKQVIQGVIEAVDERLLCGPIGPFISIDGLQVGTLEPGKAFTSIVGNWPRLSAVEKQQVMERAGVECRRSQNVVPKVVVLVSICGVSPTVGNPLSVPAMVALGSTVDRRVGYAVKMLERVDTVWHVHARSPWTPPYVRPRKELADGDALMKAFWSGYKLASSPGET